MKTVSKDFVVERRKRRKGSIPNTAGALYPPNHHIFDTPVRREEPSLR